MIEETRFAHLIRSSNIESIRILYGAIPVNDAPTPDEFKVGDWIFTINVKVQSPIDDRTETAQFHWYLEQGSWMEDYIFTANGTGLEEANFPTSFVLTRK